MELSAAVLSLVMSQAGATVAPPTPFQLMSLANVASHCFETFAKESKLDPLGYHKPGDTVLKKTPVTLCIVASLEGAGWCRFSIEMQPGADKTRKTRSVVSWNLSLPYDRRGKPDQGIRGWMGFSADYDEATLKGVMQVCALVPRPNGGGVIGGSFTILDSRDFLEARVFFSPTGERFDEVPPEPKAKQ
jgi:hypothetical protein